MFESWSLKKKLITSFVAVSMILVGVGTFGAWKLKQISGTYSAVLDDTVNSTVALSNYRGAGAMMTIQVSRWYGLDVNAQDYAEGKKLLEEQMQTSDKWKEVYLSSPFAPGEEVLWKPLDANMEKLHTYAEKIIALSKEPSQKVARDAEIDKYTASYMQFRADLIKLLDFQDKTAEQIAAETASESNTAIFFVLAAIVIGLVASMILGLVLGKNISAVLTAVTERLSGGANEVASAATQISSTSEELSSAATEQAASLQETAASVEEMSAMIKKSADNSSHSRELSTSSKDTAQRGKHTVEEMISAINEIDASNRDIAEVVKVIADIGSKTKVINDIVFKTQLLSFNASVEAARAGEHGKGFAVVAEEVGNLAQMSGTAANQISSMLDESLTKVERLISTNKSKVEAGLSVSKRCGDVLDEIVKDIENVNGLSSEIETAMQEQSRGVNEITKAMAQLDQVTQQNASASQQAASAAEQLSGQASVLQSSVVDLEGIIYGGGQRQTVAVAPSKRKGPKAKPPVSPVKKTGNRFATPSSDDPGFGEEAA